MSTSLIKHFLEIQSDDSIRQLLSQKGKIYTFLNPVSYLTALDNKAIFNKFDGLLSDGSLLVIAIRALYNKRVKRLSFDMTSVAPELFKFAISNNKTIYIVASKQDQVEKSVEIFKNMYPGITIQGYRNGFFKSQTEIDCEIKKIVNKSPDFLIVGMGILNQEKFLITAKENGFKGIGFTCGGFIHQTASNNNIIYYPNWANKLNLRFIYRMYKEKHTRKRYFKAFFVFPFRFFIERISSINIHL